MPCLFQFGRLFLSTDAEEALGDISPSGDCKGTAGTETAGGDGTTSRELWGAEPRTFSQVPTRAWDRGTAMLCAPPPS